MATDYYYGGDQFTSSTPAVQVVPWASSSEWEQVCALYNHGEYGRVIDEIHIWSKRVSAIPVGVESTLYLLQAIEYDRRSSSADSANSPNTTSGQWCEEVARSLYSLSLIRYLNHVSHLATKEITDTEGGSTSTLPMSQLAAHINVPEWIVNLRHEASHGANVPSLEVLRLAAEFVRNWLKENYWIPRKESENAEDGPSGPNVLAHMHKSEAREAAFAHRFVAYTTAFVAARVYKLRHYKFISDPQILELVLQTPAEKSPSTTSASTSRTETNQVLASLKSKLAAFLRSNPAHSCTLLAEELIPPHELYSDLGSIFPQHQTPFDSLALIWSPIVKVLQRRTTCFKLVLHRLAEMHSDSNEDRGNVNNSELIALWIDKFLGLVIKQQDEEAGIDVSDVCEFLLAIAPKLSSQIFLQRVYAIMEPAAGAKKVEKLAELNSIWMDGDGEEGEFQQNLKRKNTNGANGMNRGKLFTIEDVETPEAAEALPNSTTEIPSENAPVPSPWTLDPRGSTFWSRIPIGHVFKN